MYVCLRLIIMLSSSLLSRMALLLCICVGAVITRNFVLAFIHAALHVPMPLSLYLRVGLIVKSDSLHILLHIALFLYVLIIRSEIAECHFEYLL